ncbi:MAG: SusC/RagA family TonB-linked outer membrane protein [Prolixibacteraceae bacterium]|nr:SusC/RagA family TonB-linked outer membrane protein [Prolixibacteraceae bacterium]
MKLTCLVILLGVVQVFAGKTYAQKTNISVNLKNATVEMVLQSVEEQTDFYFLYSRSIVDVDRKVDLQVKDVKVTELLSSLFAGTEVSYRIDGRQIVLSGAETNTVQQQKSISGKVTDSSGQPLPGVSVVIKGTTNGTITDFAGKYTLANVPGDATLVFSFVGMKAQEISVAGKTSVNVRLEEETIGIEEVVAVGYGVTKKSDLTGSVASIGSEAMERQSATNVTELLRGTLPGINVGISTSAKGTSGLEIRGPTSLGAGNSPLIVVDDVIFNGDIADINPMDIERIDVLKDASSAAIYGAKAAAGVIIITTKRGAKLKPTINVRSTVGLATPNKMEEVYDAEGYLNYRADVLDRFDIASPPGYYSNPANLPGGVTVDQWLGYDNLQGTSTPPADIWYGRLQLQQIEVDNYKAGNSLDWKDILFQTGLRTDNNISLSGKTNNLSYYTSIGYVDNEGIDIYETYKSFRARVNLEADVTNYLAVGMNVQFKEDSSPTGLPDTGSAYDKNSPLGSLYNEDGTYKVEPHDDNLGINPYLYEYRDNLYKQRDLTANLYGKLTLPYGFSYRINWTNRYYFRQDYQFRSSKVSLGEGGSSGSRRDVTLHDWMVDNILKWNKKFGEHSFDVTLLYNVEENNYWNSYQDNSEFDPNESLSYHNLSIGASPSISQDDTRSTGDAAMARLNYGLFDKYLLTLSVRRDGYSAFGQDNPRAIFPSAALAWRITEENFIHADWLTNLKLRLSWGENGNREIGQYAALSKMNTTKYIYDHSSVTGIYTTNLANKELKWERTAAYNVGVDFAMLDGKISGAIDAYHMSTTDLLLERSLPNITGYADVFANLGEVQNQGIELSLNTINIDKTDFSWSSSFSFWFNRNEIKHLYGDMVDVVDEEGNVIGQREEDDIQNGWYIGHAIDEIFDYKVLGIWQLGEEEEALKYGRAPGDAKLLDGNDDGVINFDDKVFQGYKKPRYRVSLRNDFTYKNFDLSFLINSYLGYYGANNQHFNYRTAQERLNKIITPYWTVDNPTNEWTRLYSNNNSPATSWWENRSFVRVQNITVGYRVPNNLLRRLDIKKIRVFANVQNLPAISGWEYNWDVETSNPTPMIFTFGVDLSL